MTSSDSEIEIFLRDVSADRVGIETTFERKGKVVRLWMHGPAPGSRTASVSRHHQLMYVLWLDGLYSLTRLDEDLDREGEEDLLRFLIRIGEQYVIRGGDSKRTRFFRTPYIELLVDGSPVRVYRAKGIGYDAD